MKATRTKNRKRNDMTDAQLLTIALAIIIPLSLLLYSNSRITDTKETLSNRIADTKETLRADIQALRMEIMAGLEKISGEIRDVRSDLKIHELEHHHK